MYIYCYKYQYILYQDNSFQHFNGHYKNHSSTTLHLLCHSLCYLPNNADSALSVASYHHRHKDSHTMKQTLTNM